MNCECLSVVKKNIAKHFKPQAGEDVEVNFENIVGQFIGNSLVTKIGLPFRVKGSGKGFKGEKGRIELVTASFCPFCGESTKHEVENEITP
jgi:hypothetical protein